VIRLIRLIRLADTGGQETALAWRLLAITWFAAGPFRAVT
jgi:hypothetical protein